MNIADHVVDRLMARQDSDPDLKSAGIDLENMPKLMNFQTDPEKLQSIIQESTSNLDT